MTSMIYTSYDTTMEHTYISRSRLNDNETKYKPRTIDIKLRHQTPPTILPKQSTMHPSTLSCNTPHNKSPQPNPPKHRKEIPNIHRHDSQHPIAISNSIHQPNEQTDKKIRRAKKKSKLTASKQPRQSKPPHKPYPHQDSPSTETIVPQSHLLSTAPQKEASHSHYQHRVHLDRRAVTHSSHHPSKVVPPGWAG